MTKYLNGGTAPEEGAVYFFDTNVWMFVINPPPDPIVDGQPYLDFFDAIINLADNDRCKRKPKIYVNVLVITEVVNALLRAHLKARNDSSADEINFKTYRATQHYEANLRSIKDDFAIYRRYLLEDTPLDVHGLDLLQGMPTNADYNDFIYATIAKEKSLIVVTHDRDYQDTGVDIITANTRIR